MKIRSLLACAALVALACAPSLRAADKPDLKTDLAALVDRIKAKLATGASTEDQLADELKGFDTILAAHKDEKTDEASEVLAMEAGLYIEVFHDASKGIELVKRIKTDFPETALGRQADEIVAGLEKQAAGERIQRDLAVGTMFPDFNEKDTAGHPLSVANYKGKVVLVDFWATWCGPCLAELPNVVKTYQQLHDKGFEVIGISLDHEGDGEKLAAFTKEHEMAWPQYFDGLYWSNKLAVKYGVNSIPNTFLLDGEGRIIGKDLRGDALSAAVIKALLAK
jgi:peroxiredoxin